MRVCVLGPVEAHLGDAPDAPPLDLGGPKQRALLAALRASDVSGRVWHMALIVVILSLVAGTGVWIADLSETDGVLFVLNALLVAVGVVYAQRDRLTRRASHKNKWPVEGFKYAAWIASIGGEVIGFSVVYKAFENMDGFRKVFGWQPNTKAAVLIFGFFHGFGLATKLQDFALSPNGLVTNIVSFNIGVEIGQFLALSAILIAITYWRMHAAFMRHAFTANAVVMAAGVPFGAYRPCQMVRLKPLRPISCRDG